MNSGPQDSIGPFVPPSLIIPEDWNEARLILTEYLFKAAQAINSREIAQYQDANLDMAVNISETVNGQAWYTPGDPNKFRYGSRTVVVCGALPNTALKAVPHGISVTSNTRFTRIYGVANNPSTSFIPLPYVNTVAGQVKIEVDATNVNITTDANFTAYTDSFVVLEYVENV